MAKRQQKIWRKNFEIQRVDYQMPYLVMGLFYNSSRYLGLRPYIKEGIWVTENSNNTGTYFVKAQLRAMVEAILQKVISAPAEIDKLHARTLQVNASYFNLAKKMEKIDYQHVNNRGIARWYKKIMAAQILAHSMALTTTWLLDSDGEDFSNYLLNYLNKQISNLKIKNNPAEVFSVLTTPLKDSMARIEEKELLNIIIKIQKCVVAKRILSNKNVEWIEKNFERLPKDIQELILRHYEKWRWTPYTYIGPAYELDYYLEIIAGLLRQKIQPKKLLCQYAMVHEQNRKEQQVLFKKFKVDKQMRHIFKIAQDIIYIKGFRKDCLYYGGYVRDILLKEVARRLDVSLMQVKYFTPDEVVAVLGGHSFSIDELNERMKFSVIYMKNGKNTILLGKKAKRFLAKQIFEKIKIDNLKDIKGTCACPGKAKGAVKIVNLPEDMIKMNKGDIMISHTTFPALVPAMKKAAAIVTEDGGITCHAAIVAREMKKPCIIGAKNATQILKDGDAVEVNANHGIVRKISA